MMAEKLSDRAGDPWATLDGYTDRGEFGVQAHMLFEVNLQDAAEL